MSCPSVESLTRLLEGESTDEWNDHIAQCDRCQSFLEQLTDDPELKLWRNGNNIAPPEPALAEFLAKVQSFDHCVLDDRKPCGNSHPFLGPPLRPGDAGVLGSFHIESELGRGGMGVVFRAYDPTLNRTVAIKVLRPATDDSEARSRLLREARALARLEHPNIVHVHAISETENGVPYLVLEYVAGQSLAERLRTGDPLPPRAAADLIARIGDGLKVAHEAGLIHRDVKPANILMCGTDHSAIPKISDFGLVRTTESTATASGMLAGTPAYMSPEQIRDPARIDARADVYGLGATLFECLTGDVPFRGATAMVLRQVMDDEPRSPRRFSDAIPRDLEIICLKALAKDRGSRYPSAAELAADLRRFLANEPIHARPAGTAERIIRWTRRKPLPAALSAALLLVGILGLGGVIWQWREAVARATEAEDNLRDAASAVDQFLTRVSEDKLIDTPGFEPLRKQLLEDALTYYQRLLQKRGAGLAMRIETAKAADRAARLVTILRPGADQLAAWERAVACWEACPDAPGQRDEWITCQLNRGLALIVVDRYDDAMNLVQGIAKELNDRAAANPNHVPYQRDVAGVTTMIADIHAHAGRQDEARVIYAQARQAFERLLQLNPNNLRDLRRLTFCLNSWAMTLPPDQSMPLYDEARGVQEKALILSKRAPEDLRMMGRIEHYRGVALTKLHRPDEARAAIASACQHLQQLCDASPDVTPYRQNLASALHWLGSSQFDAKLPEAAATFARAKTEYERLLAGDPESEKIKNSLAGVDAFQKNIAAKNAQATKSP